MNAPLRSAVRASAALTLAVLARSAVAAPPAPLPPLPTADQLAWQSGDFALYVRFDLATFTGDSRDPRRFNPPSLDPRAWARAAHDIGCTRVVVSANDADGFCLWPTRTTAYSIAHTPWRDGKGDLLRDFVIACREAGLSVGISVTGYEHGSPVADATLLAKLRELLTGYGPIDELRLDGAGGEGTQSTPSLPAGLKRPQRDWPAVFAAIRQLQPHTIIVSNVGPDARWNGNNIGHAGEPQWSLFKPEALPGPELTDKSQLKLLNLGDPDGDQWVPAECFIPLRPHWTWEAADDAKLIAPDRLFTAYCKSTGRNCVLLVNVPLTPDGTLPAADVSLLTGLHEAVTRALAENLALGARAAAGNTRDHDDAFAASRAIDGNRNTFWATDDAAGGERWLEIDFGAPKAFNMVELREPIALGQRVATYRIEVPDGGGWKPIVPAGKSIGRHKLERFPTVTATKVRLVIDQSRGAPVISEFGVYLQR